MKHYRTHERGIALLITLLLMSVLLTVSASLLNITLKQYQFSSIGVASEQAFQAANAGLECMVWHDYEDYPTSKFDVDTPTAPNPAGPTIECMGVNDSTSAVGAIGSGEEQRYRFSWRVSSDPDIPELCTDVSIYKFYELGTADGNPTGPSMDIALGQTGQNCAEDVVCTVIRARGYNVACPADDDDPFPPRTIEREITQRY